MGTILSSIIGSEVIDELYVLVKWPFVQDLMGYEWFRKECYLLNVFFDEQEYFDSAYFVPIARIMAIIEPG